jgi:hypothetical protein
MMFVFCPERVGDEISAAESTPSALKFRESLRVYARKLRILIVKPVWFINETFPRHDEVLHRFAGLVKHDEHVYVIRLY